MKSELAIKRINSIENEIHNIWSDLNFYNLSQLEEAWNDPVCKEFIERINNLDNVINNIVSNLEVLKEDWLSYEAKELVDGELNGGVINE